MASIIRGFGHAAVTQTSSGLDIPAAQAVALTDGEGNLIRTVANGDGTATLGGGASTFITYPSSAETAANTGVSFSTAGVSALAVDVDVTAFTGGTSPTVTFFVDRLGSDNVWYRTWTSSALSSTGPVSEVIGPYPTATGITTAVLTGTARFGWTFSGSPTSVTFSASVIGR